MIADWRVQIVVLPECLRDQPEILEPLAYAAVRRDLRVGAAIPLTIRRLHVKTWPPDIPPIPGICVIVLGSADLPDGSARVQ
jgi:hypothetical protein